MKFKLNASLFFILIAFLLFGATACNKTEIDSSFDTTIDDAITINNNFDELNTRLEIYREPVLFTGNTKVLVPDDCGNYTWYFVAEIAAPLFNGEPLSATDVRVLGDRAYVTYQRQGDVHAGGIEIIDISDPGLPVIRSYMEFDGVDINSLAIDDLGTEAERRIWLAGSSFKKGAILRQVIANDGYLNGGVVDISLSKILPVGSISASANSIALSSDYIYMSAGNSVGGTFQLNRNSLTFVSHQEYSDAKAVALNGKLAGNYQLTLIGGDNAKLNVYRIGTDRTLVRSIPLGSIVHQNVAEPYLGKATVTISEGSNIAYIAMNSGGMKAVNIETGQVIFTSPANMLTTGNTHGVVTDGGTIYMANSDDGLFIGCIPTAPGEIFQAQHWDLDEVSASANMVQTDGDWVFVAKGGGGLKILKKVDNSVYPSVDGYDNNGRPNPTPNTEVLCEDLIPNFKAVLSEKKDAMRNLPNLFENKNSELILTEKANVTLTFVMESSDYKNSLGYFTYNVQNPPKKIDDIRSNMKLIFANSSAEGSGGTLKEGDQVNLGTFEAGTVIGYFLVSDGWNGYETTEGLYSFFTNSKLNRENSQQSLMLYSESCGTLISAFEDMHSRSGDRDFNDLVIKTTVSPMTAMNVTFVNKIK